MVPRANGVPVNIDRLSGAELTQLVPISTWRLRLFHVIAHRRLSNSFRALRLANQHRAPLSIEEPLVVALNHPSWWDPLVGFALSRWLLPGRRFYAPIDAEALQRYGIFRRLGLFPVAMHSARGAAQFLRAGGEVLDRGYILAVTPQGHFTDVRERPVVFRPGLASLLHRRSAQGKRTTVLPLALEYTFWDQRLPEALVNCGTPLSFGSAPEGIAGPSQRDIHTALERAMEQTQDELRALAMRRDPAAFRSLLEGRRGSAGWYGWIERLRSVAKGRRGRGDHTASAIAAANTHTAPPKP
ncbi:lysophospholipid acyltransferase family protein [Terriglobus aquaticus]|uniref:Lysophospholipid acyltransferase family protein n=2 Tax=Terriglobus aquaticus TaxID=940139 RepID=A0ABW9KSR6_9BACT